MSFLKKMGSLFSKNKEIIEELEFKIEYNDENIKLTPNKSILENQNINDLINMYNIETMNNSIIVSYDYLYDLYFDDYENKIDTYKYFNLPDIFGGFINIENNNFLASSDVAYRFYFEDSEGRYNTYKGNILKHESKLIYKLMGKDLYELSNKIIKYNSNKEYRSDVAQQFETLKDIKDYSKKLDIILNQRLREELTPIVIDKIKIDFNDDGETLEIFPRLSEDDEINKSIINNINQYKDIKGTYSTNINNEKVRYVIKHKDTLEKVIKNKTNKGKNRLKILSGKSEIFEDENIDISDFGPRVTGIGYLSYKSSPSNIKTNDLNWLDNNIDFPYIQGTNVDGNFESVVLKPEDKLKLQMKLSDMMNNNEDVGELEFTSDEGNNIKLIMTVDDIKNEIQNLNSRMKSPLDINKISDLEKILQLCDEYEDKEYIPYKGMYITKGLVDIKEEIVNQIEYIKEKNGNTETDKEKKKALLIAENLEENEYIEKDKVNKVKHIVEAPKGLKEGISLFEYQNECLGKLQSLYLDSNINGFLLCDDMGLGKTLQLLSFLGWLKDRNEVTPSLIVAPTSLLNNWDSEDSGEIQKFFKEGFFKTEKVRGKLSNEDIERLKEKDIVFITYESLRMNNIALGKIHWKVMICDEAQKIKNPKTLVTVAAKAQNADFKIICSATPIENTLEDLWTLTDYSKPGLLGSLKEFKNTYINKYKNPTERDLQELNDKLYEKIEDFYIRREKDILPKSLPKKIIKIYKFKPTQIEVDYLERIKDTEEHTLTAIQKMLGVCSHVDMLSKYNNSINNIENAIKKSSKMANLKYILDDIKSKNEKVIIFTRLRKVQQIIYKAVQHWYKINCFIVNGETTSLDKRTEIINNFRKENGFSIIILSPEVAGFGITLTEANHVIHYTRLWNPAKEDQATDRAYRIGQTKDVTVHYPIISFDDEGVFEYDNVQAYVDNNMERREEDILSPEEKLNILLARKKNMLINFFLAAGDGDIGGKDFLSLDSNKGSKISIDIEDINNNIITPHEFEALVAVLYERMGYKSYLTGKSNDKGVDVICKKDNEVLFIQCKKYKSTVGTDAIKDLLFARDTYKKYVEGKNVKSSIITSSENICDSVKNRNDIEVIDKDRLSELLSKYNIYKHEIDIINDDRYSFEEMIRYI